MDPHLWKRVQAVFESAIAVDGGERAAYLADACGADHVLRQAVQALLDAESKADPLFDTFAVQAMALHDCPYGPDDQIGSYRILNRLGSGGLGVVYKAWDTRLDRHVAVKFLPAQFSLQDTRVTRYVNDARLASDLDHPHIASFFDVTTTPHGRVMMVTAYAGERDLATELLSAPMSVEKALSIMLDIVDALLSAHRNELFHGMLKPSNVILDAGRRPRLVDFGIRHLFGAMPAARRDDLVYQAPECLKGAPIDRRADVWSLGAMLFEMVVGTGVRPAHSPGDSFDPRAQGSAATAHHLRADIPAALSAVLARALHRDPAARYAQVDEIVVDLRRLQQTWPSPLRERRRAKRAILPPATRRATPMASVGGAERRQVTVMHCALVEPETPTDAEAGFRILRDFREICRKMASRYDGHIVDSIGDYVVICFGYPRAHEDDGLRAVRTGLGVLEAVRERGSPSGSARLPVRVGVHTGMVVADAAGAASPTLSIVGPVPKTAERIQSVGRADSLLVSATTFRLISGFFACQAIGSYQLSPADEPTLVYRVLHESGARNRLEAPGVALTPLEGRTDEREELIAHWRAVVAGGSRFVMLEGEAGIGKSRLVRELKEEVSRDPSAWLISCYCSPYHRNSALFPVIDYLSHTTLQFEPGEPASARLTKLEGLLTQYGLSLPDHVPLFSPLLSISLDERYAPTQMSPARQLQRLFAALAAMVSQRATHQPLLLVFEDLHWADPTTVQFVPVLRQLRDGARVLMLATYRPEFKPGWDTAPVDATMVLRRLAPEQIRRMARHVAGRHSLSAPVLTGIVQKTDGIPLFVEEITKAVVESDAPARDGAPRTIAPDTVVPVGLRETLMARLDRLGEAKHLAQLAAVLGREFSYALLRAACAQLSEDALQTHLADLVSATLLVEDRSKPQPTYRFRHALIQEAAYGSMLVDDRTHLHRDIAELLERQFPELCQSEPEWVARHYTQAGLYAEAISFWRLAGEQARARSANREAIHHLQEALHLLEFAGLAHRSALELAVLMELGPCLMAVKGYADTDVQKVYVRARELCQGAGDTPYLARALFGLWTYYVVRGELYSARELGEQLSKLAQRMNHPDLLLESDVLLEVTLFYMGDIDAAWQHGQQAIARYDRQRHAFHALQYGQDPGMAAQSYAAAMLWWRGHPAEALRASDAALQAARALSHVHSRAFALFMAARVQHQYGDAEATLALADETIAVSTEHGFPTWRVLANVMRGWALQSLGQVEEGLAAIQVALQTYGAIGAGLSRPYYAALLGQAYARAGQVEDGLSRVAQAIADAEAQGGLVDVVEMHRIHAELLLQLGRADEAESAFMQALHLAEQQGAHAWGLRAALSQARWQLDSGRVSSAIALLEVWRTRVTADSSNPDRLAADALYARCTATKQ